MAYQSEYTGAEIDDAAAKRHTHNNKAILDDITASYTTEDKTKLDGIDMDSKQDKITSTNKLDYSLLNNTPTIPTVPTNVSAFTNDAGYVTNAYHDSTKQDTLVSGTNIKTINGNNILGSGNIEVRRWRHMGKHHRNTKRPNRLEHGINK